MPTFTCKEHATAANDKLKEAILSLDKKGKTRLLKAMAMSLTTMPATNNAPTRSMDEPSTLEGVPQDQRVGQAPPVTTTINITAPTTVQTTPHTHQHTTRHNIPGITLAIEHPSIKTRD